MSNQNARLPVATLRGVSLQRVPKYLQGDMRVVLVRDASGSMNAADKAPAAQRACDALLQHLVAIPGAGTFQAALVDFASTASTAVPLTPAAQLAAVGCPVPGIGGGTSISAGLEEAERVLADGQASPYLPTAVVLFTDGGHNEGGAPDDAAARLRARGVLVCVAFGADADESLLARLATPGCSTRCADAAELVRLFDALGKSLSRSRQAGAGLQGTQQAIRQSIAAAGFQGGQP